MIISGAAFGQYGNITVSCLWLHCGRLEHIHCVQWWLSKVVLTAYSTVRLAVPTNYRTWSWGGEYSVGCRQRSLLGCVSFKKCDSEKHLHLCLTNNSSQANRMFSHAYCFRLGRQWIWYKNFTLSYHVSIDLIIRNKKLRNVTHLSNMSKKTTPFLDKIEDHYSHSNVICTIRATFSLFSIT